MSKTTDAAVLLTEQLASLESLEPQLRQLISAIIEQPGFAARFNAEQVIKLQTLQPDTAQLLRSLVPLAQTYSHAPISNFHVGAVALGISGSIYLGANIEFSGQTLGQTVHAEQCVITNAWSHGESVIKQLAISAAPCGHCRQFINELTDASEINVLLPNQQPIKFDKLLPQSFGPSDLGVNDRLMQSSINDITLTSNDQLAKQALSAAINSYSPYSSCPSGVAIATADAVFTGRYAENCAYNPSLAPLQGALINLRLARVSFNDIKRVILVEKQLGDVSQDAINRNMLEQLSVSDYQRIGY